MGYWLTEEAIHLTQAFYYSWKILKHIKIIFKMDNIAKVISYITWYGSSPDIYWYYFIILIEKYIYNRNQNAYLQFKTWSEQRKGLEF